MQFIEFNPMLKFGSIISCCGVDIILIETKVAWLDIKRASLHVRLMVVTSLWHQDNTSSTIKRLSKEWILNINLCSYSL